jgi:hypothetical protein
LPISDRPLAALGRRQFTSGPERFQTFGLAERGYDPRQGGPALAVLLDHGRGRALACELNLSRREPLADAYDRRGIGKSGHERGRCDRTGEKREPKHWVYHVERTRPVQSKSGANRVLAGNPVELGFLCRKHPLTGKERPT